MGQPNFLIGRGQMLTAVIDTPRKDYPPKAMPYSFAEAKASLLPEFLVASHELDEEYINRNEKGRGFPRPSFLRFPSSTYQASWLYKYWCSAPAAPQNETLHQAGQSGDANRPEYP